jgi:hypothetical protein
MRTEYIPTHKTAREIQNDIELMRRISAKSIPVPIFPKGNRRRIRANHRLRMAVALSAVAATIAAAAYFWKP